MNHYITSFLLISLVLGTILSCSSPQKTTVSNTLPVVYLTPEKTMGAPDNLVFSQENDRLVSFTPANKSTIVSIKNGLLIIHPIDQTAVIQKEVSFDTNSYAYLSIRMNAHENTASMNSPAASQKLFAQKMMALSIAWKKQGQSSYEKGNTIEQNIPLVSLSNKKTYTIVLDEKPEWHGLISEISIRFTSLRSVIEIDRISLEPGFPSKAPFSRTRATRNNDRRPVFVINKTTHFSTALHLNHDAFLSFGLTTMENELAKTTVATQFYCLFTISDMSGRQTLYKEKLSVFTKNTTSWEDVKIPLDAFTGKSVRLTWSVAFEENSIGQNSEPDCLLSQPVITTPALTTDTLNCILISLDTLRADHLGCYGYPKNISPTIDFLARKGMTVMRGRTPYPSTAPAHVSLMTGLLPSEHGVLKGSMKMKPDTITLAELFARNGYFTKAVTGGGNVSMYHRFDKGFAQFDDSNRQITSLKENVLPWLEKNERFPFFLFYHTYEIHAPFPAHQPITEYFYPDYEGQITGKEYIYKRKKLHITGKDLDYLVALYDSGIRYTDAALGKLLSTMHDKHLFHNTLLVLLSDHGEHFAEHDLYGHGISLFDQLLDVPIIVNLKDFFPQGHCFDSYMNLIDVPASIAHWLKLPAPIIAQQFDQPRDLKSQTEENYSFAELKDFNFNNDTWNYSCAVMKDDYKLLSTKGKNNLFFYDSELNQKDLSGTETERKNSLQKILDSILMKIQASNNEDHASEHAVFDDDTKNRLNALGYLEN